MYKIVSGLNLVHVFKRLIKHVALLLFFLNEFSKVNATQVCHADDSLSTKVYIDPDMLKVTGKIFWLGMLMLIFKSYIIPPNTVKKLEIEGLAQLTDEYSSIEISRLTIQHNITTLDDFGNTVLHRAVLDGDSDLVKFLLSVIRFNSGLENKNGKSAREMAIASKNQKLITTFNNQAQVDLRLLKALVAGDKAAAQTFMLVGANPNLYVKVEKFLEIIKYTPYFLLFVLKIIIE